AIDDIAIVRGRAPAASLSRLPFNRQQHPQNTPLDLCQIAAAQGCLPESAALNQNEIHASMILSTRPRTQPYWVSGALAPGAGPQTTRINNPGRDPSRLIGYGGSQA